jgi:hypothetical protein
LFPAQTFLIHGDGKPARRLKELEQEIAKLKRLVADLSLGKLVLKDIASGILARSQLRVTNPASVSASASFQKCSRTKARFLVPILDFSHALQTCSLLV